MPNYHEDFIGAAAGLFRLQETFAITARAMAEGNIQGQLFELLLPPRTECNVVEYIVLVQR